MSEWRQAVPDLGLAGLGIRLAAWILEGPYQGSVLVRYDQGPWTGAVLGYQILLDEIFAPEIQFWNDDRTFPFGFKVKPDRP